MISFVKIICTVINCELTSLTHQHSHSLGVDTWVEAVGMVIETGGSELSPVDGHLGGREPIVKPA